MQNAAAIRFIESLAKIEIGSSCLVMELSAFVSVALSHMEQQRMGMEKDREDKAPTKGTDEPWKRPNQTSQNPDQPEPKKPDLEKWKNTETH